MNTQFSQNVQPPAGWTVQTYIDATGNVQVGHTFSPIWPFSVYPPLPSGHPMSLPASIPPGLPQGAPGYATITGSLHAPQKSPPPRSSNQSPVGNAAAMAPVHTPPMSSSYTPSASWNQLLPSSVYPPAFHPQWYNMYGGYYYPPSIQGQGSIYPPSALPKPPLGNDVANCPPTTHRHSSVSSKTSKTTTPPPPKEDTCCHKEPTGVAGLPAMYEFTFKCSPQVDLQQCCSPQPGQDLQEHSQDTHILLADSAGDEPILVSSKPAQETSELPFDDLDTFQRLLDAFIQQEEVPQQETSSLPCEADPVQDDEAAAQLIWSILTAPQAQQDAAGDVKASGFPLLPSSPSPAPSTSSSETQMSGSTLVSTWSAAGSSWKTESPSIHGDLPPQQGMFSARPSAQTTSGQKGDKRSSETENPEPNAEPHEPKRRRVTPEGSADRKYWCTKCLDWVAVNRRKIHERNRKHSGQARFSCRICRMLGVINQGHSRKDSLKRHIIQQHQQYGPIWETFPQLLSPYIEGEDLGYLGFIPAPQ